MEDIEDGNELEGAPPPSPNITSLTMDMKKASAGGGSGGGASSQPPVDPLKKLKSISSAPKDSRLREIVKEKPKARPGTAPPEAVEEDEYRVRSFLL